MSIFALAFVVGTCLIAIVLPWIGVLAYYLFSIMQMQHLWPLAFGEARVQLLITVATIVGLAGSTALKLVDWNRLLTPFSLLMFLLVILVNMSTQFSTFNFYIDPIEDLNIPGKLTNVQILSVFNKTLFFYFVASLLIDSRKKLEWSIYVFAGMLLFYAYWANKVYLTGEYWLFGINGRLGGPLGSNYFDENYLAMLYVLATPVLYYIGVARKMFFFRYAIWALIPLTWHALFLTSSRGGTVGLVLAVVFQSGQLLNRVTDTIEASENLTESSEERLDPRLISWGVSTEIMREYPIFGVGVGNFIKAFPNFSDTNPHVAHNTYFQFSANCGILSGLIYLSLFIRRLPTLRRSADLEGTRNFPRGFKRDYLDDLLNSLFLAFFMVAIFLDLMIYEIMYFIFLLSFSKYILDRKDAPEKHRLIDSIYRFREKKREEVVT